MAKGKSEKRKPLILLKLIVIYTSSFFLSNLGFSLILLLLLFSGLYYDLSLILRNDSVTGIDGYYYVLQVKTLQNEGRFYFPTNTPLILFLLTALSYITSDISLAVKIIGVILHTFLCFGILALITLITKSNWLGIIGIFLTLFSALHLYYVVEFLNNLGALAFLAWAVVGIIKFCESKKKIWLIFCISMIILAILSHRSTIYLIFASFFIWCISYYISYKQVPNLKLRYIIFIGCFLLTTLPIILKWQSFLLVPDWLTNEILKYPQQPFRILTLMESQIMLVVSVFFLGIFYFHPYILKKSLAGLILAFLVLWTILFSLNPFLNHQTGFKGIIGRLDSLMFLQVSISLPLMIFLLKSLKKTYLLTLFLFIPLLALRYFAPLPVGLNQKYLVTRQRITQVLLDNQSQFCDNPLIIARHGEEFLVTATLNIPSQQKFPTENKYKCIYWLIHQPSNTDYAQISQLEKNNEITLVEDTEFRTKLYRMNPKEIFELSRINTHVNLVIKDVLDKKSVDKIY